MRSLVPAVESLNASDHPQFPNSSSSFSEMTIIMFIRSRPVVLFAFLVAPALAQNSTNITSDNLQYVDPLIGSANGGLSLQRQIRLDGRLT